MATFAHRFSAALNESAGLLCATDKRGISPCQLSNLLDVCYETAWFFLARIRTAMGQRDADYVLSGLVELDDCYPGGPCSGGKRGRGTDKSKVVVALSKTDHGIPLFAHMQVVEDFQTKTLQEFVYQYTRWYCSYRVLPNPFL